MIRIGVTAIVTPPMGLLWLALLGVAIYRRWPRLGRLSLALGLVGMYVAGTPIASHALVAGLEALDPAASDGTDPPGAIVILGGDGERVAGAAGAGTARPGPLSTERLAWGAVLARKTRLPVLITGGTVGRGQPPVADLMATTYAEAFGLPVAWREERSLNTCENAAFSADILRRSGVGSAFVVTHAWHMKRALLSFARAGYPVQASPLPPERYEVDSVTDFMPRITGWNRTYYALHEWIGLIAYRFGACRSSAS